MTNQTLIVVLLSLFICTFPLQAAPAPDPRQVILLDGTWQIAEGAMDQVPAHFDHSIPVPGLVDMARPAFEEVGVKSPRREAFWYRRTFKVEKPIPAFAFLTVHKAMFGTRVLLNGTQLGDHLPSFTPGTFAVHAALRQGDNEILIRVGAFRDSLPKGMPNGWDYEKYLFTPGIFDSVDLVLSGAPHIQHVQVAPNITAQTARVQVSLLNADTDVAISLKLTLREAKTGALVTELTTPRDTVPRGARMTIDAVIPVAHCHLWSPEDPFLYDLTVDSGKDSVQTRFGMREFHLDPSTGRAVLNGKPYFMRGSNVTLYRFFEDSERKDLPWREDWVRDLHRKFKEMHWNCLRYCIGFPPELWYRIADEEGFLIQDEFPIWNMDARTGAYDSGELAQEFTEWMQEQWNHPSVVIWDACNETRVPETGEAIRKVRQLDLSNRPWDNGWSPGVEPGDSSEQHPYHFSNPHFKLADIARDTGTLGWKPGQNPIIVNEYGWLWLNRDGTPTTLTKDLYRNLIGPNSTTDQRRHLYARYLAAETEFWRCHRAMAAVMEFCALSYSRPGEQARPQGGATSDHWIDVEKLTWEPEFFHYVRDAFAPVGLMVDAWAAEYTAGKTQGFPVVAINDLNSDWRGNIRFRVLLGEKVVQEKTQPCEIPALGSVRLTFSLDIPRESGSYQLEAALVRPNDEIVRSLRDFTIISEEELAARRGMAVGKPVKASSNLAQSGATSPEAAVDGQMDTRWSSEFSDPQWIAVDLQKPEQIGRIVLDWEAAYAKAYSIDVSLDGVTWNKVYETDHGNGGSEEIKLNPVEARWVRMTGTQRATEFGYSLWEFRIFPAAVR